MILQFVIAALLLLIIFSCAMVIPFIKSKQLKSIDKERRNQLNHELYDIRLKEVEEDVDQGVVINQQEVVNELQYNLLDDINENEVSKQNNKTWIWIPGVIFFIVSTLLTYWSIGAFNEVNNWQTSLKNYPEIQKKLFEQPNVRSSDAELKDLMLGLRSHLNNEPNDAKGWVLYSRLGRVFQDQKVALEAINKARLADPDNIKIQLESIELKMKIGDEYAKEVAQLSLIAFLKKHPDSYEGWLMYGFIALQQENFTAAITRWQMILALVTPGSEQADTLNNSIAYAKEQLALQASQQARGDAAVQGIAYQVTVTLGDQASYQKNSTLFVYAQSVDGPAMPIAAIKLPVTEFPVTLTMSDANAMMQGVKLSDYKAFIIKARISNDGSVNTSSGQWFGSSDVIEAGQNEVVNVEINQKT